MEKKDIVIVISCVALLIYWYSNQSELPIEIVEEQSQPSQIEKKELSEDISTVRNTPLDVSEAQPPENLPSPTISSIKKIDIEKHSPAHIIATPEHIRIKIEPDYGGITAIDLPKYKEALGGNNIRFEHPKENPLLSIHHNTEKWVFGAATVHSSSDEHITISRPILGKSLTLEQTWRTFPDKTYELHYSISLKNTGQKSIDIGSIEIHAGAMPKLQSGVGGMGSGRLQQKVDVLFAVEKKTGTFSAATDVEEHETGIIEKITSIFGGKSHSADAKNSPIDWIAVQNKYFASILYAEKPFSGFDIYLSPAKKEDGRVFVKDEKQKILREKTIAGFVYLPVTSLEKGEHKTWEINYFIGPKKYDLLQALGKDTEAILNFDLFLFFHAGWMKSISLGILWCLNKAESIFKNYGVAIIIITFLIKMIFWPITHRTTVWSKKMQTLQPLMQEMKEKYKNSPQEMQAETMKLYKEHKINPLGGCLPMFIQIPIFFALFNVLRSAIELRQAEFLWVADLSEQDTLASLLGIPINPLAMLMGVTMIWQQKITPSSADPMQQKMMMFMSLFFVMLLYKMPSGLTLYWSVNQILSIIQYKVTHRPA